MDTLSATTVNRALPYSSLIPALQQAFCQAITAPMRHHHDMDNPGHRETTLLLMPAWQAGDKVGVKLVTVAPDHSPAIQGIYLLMDLASGRPELMMDAPALTARRTAAASALAASFLAPTQARTLLMVGTGTLSKQLIQAHCAVRPIERVLIWGRDFNKAQCLAQSLPQIHCQPIRHLETGCREADVISVATLARTPLIDGHWLRPGQHLDLVGAYRPDMREANDEAVRRCQLFVDTRQGALKETGELVIPLQQGLISDSDIVADLFDLCRKTHPGRTDEHQLTLFKSVGHALEDLAAAKLVASYWRQHHDQ
ncbi:MULTISPECIES: ornithine cyclodeaminase family protein [Ferrimonas]|uniref:ornithine cyclodeaminase family protein n=1 Tax=Ferrimonas TaxID=44011 RepID=UPI0003FED721|nr:MULTISPECIES: ornithine cyclodeaminase family protein [Ferrimonas]USD39059.1 ornithine cyclodeaminase family protein [Ferrimonas sp. SCSIO 43195]